MSIERADTQYTRNATNYRSVKIGAVTRHRNHTAVEIARALRKESALGRLEQKLADKD